MMNEKLSAWMDGELAEEHAEHFVASLLRHPDMRAACATAWMVGDEMRGEPAVSQDFSARLMTALEKEPVVFSPASVPARAPREALPTARWMPIAASVAGVLFVGWLAFGIGGAGNGGQPEALAAAQVAATPVAATSPARLSVSTPSNVDDDRAYIMAHYASGAGAPVPGAAPFIRTVSSEQVGPDQ